MNTKLFQYICLHLYDIRRRFALVMLVRVDFTAFFQVSTFRLEGS